MWFNPPFNMSVTTNVGTAFLRLIDKHYKKDNPLSKIINHNTVKVSNSCTKNVKSLIDSHNQKILQDEKRGAPVKPCNCQCQNKPNCALKGECVQKDAIYCKACIFRVHVSNAKYSWRTFFSYHTYIYIIYIYIMHDICPIAKNPCRENLYSAKRKQFMCAKNPCFTVAIKIL